MRCAAFIVGGGDGGEEGEEEEKGSGEGESVETHLVSLVVGTCASFSFSSPSTSSPCMQPDFVPDKKDLQGLALSKD